MSEEMKRIPLLLALGGAALAVKAAGPPASPTEKPDEYQSLRHRMVDHQLTAPGRDISNPRVLDVMRAIPRHEFVPEESRDRAYADSALPIGHGQTISQPFIVAFMTQALDPRPGDRVLEIGTGSGYQAAVLSPLVHEVRTIEIVPELAARARATLDRLGYDNVHVKSGDGFSGWPEHAPFDAIIVTCAPEDIPQPLVDQLRDGGRLVIPVGPTGGNQNIHLIEKNGDTLTTRKILPVRFVPMTGKSQEE